MKKIAGAVKKSALMLLLLGVIFLLAACCMKHEWKDATCTEPKTCVKCGETEGIELHHDWQEETCTEAQKCSICGSTRGEPLGHWWEEATYEKPKTCKRCGETEGEPLQLIYQDGLFLLSPKELGERIDKITYGAEMYYNANGMYCGITSIIDWGDMKKGDAIAVILFGARDHVMGISEKDSKTVQSLTAKFFVTDPTTITSTMVDLMMACDGTLDDDTAREVGKKVVTAAKEGDISYTHNGLTYTFTQHKSDYMFIIAVT